MTRNILCHLFALVLLLLGSGCMEEAVLLTVNKDGSGTIQVRGFLSPQLTQMMESMGGMMEGMTEGMTVEGGDAPEMPDMDVAAMMEKGVREKAGTMGEGVTLTDYKPGTNKAGWKGFTATYAFTDISRVKLSVGDIGGGQEAGGGMSSDAAYTFAFRPGDPAVLKILPAPDEASSTEDAGAEESAGDMATGDQESEGMETGDTAMEGEEMEGMGMEGMEAMMAPMLAGMRLALFVRVEGDIRETNSSYPSSQHQNLITVMDMQMDAVVKNQEAFKLITSEDPAAQARLQQMNIPGLKLADMDKTIEVAF